MGSLVIKIFLCACETWTLSNPWRRNATLGSKTSLTRAVDPFEALPTTLLERKFRCYEHISSSSGMVLKRYGNGARRLGMQENRWEDNIKERTGLNSVTTQRTVKDIVKWRENTRMCQGLVKERGK